MSTRDDYISKYGYDAVSRANDPENTQELRDWFAGMALQGLLAFEGSQNGEDFIIKRDVEHAYKYADAMLKARGNES